MLIKRRHIAAPAMANDQAAAFCLDLWENSQAQFAKFHFAVQPVGQRRNHADAGRLGREWHDCGDRNKQPRNHRTGNDRGN